MGKNAIEKAYDTLRNYNGSNNYINFLKYQYEKGEKVLSDFEMNYILDNKSYKESNPNRIVKITSELGTKLQEKYCLSIVPNKIKITRIIGEMGGSIHCYVKYRQSEPEKLMFISLKGLLDDLFVVDWKNHNVDFNKYDEITNKGNYPRTLREHQKEGIKFLVANKRCICADEMGLGKTTTAIVSALESGSDKILIITTASLKSTWKRECELFVPKEEINVINGNNCGECKKINIINYDIVKNFYEVAEEPEFCEEGVYDNNGYLVETMKVPIMVKNSAGKRVQKMKKSRNRAAIEEALLKSPLYLNKFNCVIIDEAQKLSNNKSIRYKTIDDFLKKAKPEFIFLLTGTPLTNNPLNLYWILNLIKVDITRDYNYYISRYCGARKYETKKGQTFYKFGEPQNLDELRDKIKNVYIRRRTTDIGKMVEKIIDRRYYELTDEQEKKYNRLWEDYQKSQEGYQLSIDDYYDDFEFEFGDNDTNDKNRQLIEGGLIRQFFGREMIEHTIELVDELIEDGEKVVIITCFNKEMDKLKEYYGNKAVCYKGGMTTKQKDTAESEFQNNKNVKVFIGQVIACGVGLSLTAAKYLVFNSYDWVASNNVQAESRIHRLTSTDDVHCIYQLFDNTMSQEMFDKVVYKQMLMDTIIKSESEKK